MVNVLFAEKVFLEGSKKKRLINYLINTGFLGYNYQKCKKAA